MASLPKTLNTSLRGKSLRNTLSNFGIHNRTIRKLENEEFDLEGLRDIASNRMIQELADIDIENEEARKIKNWKNLLNIHPKPELRRQTTVSETLLKELTDNSDLRTYMDQLMDEGMIGFKYLEEGNIEHDVVLHDHHQNRFKSDLKADRQSIYYRWDKADIASSPQAFHLTLNHTDNEKRSNLTSVHRDKNGALHLRLNDGKNGDGKPDSHGRGTLARILINSVDGEYLITVSLSKYRHRYIDPVAERIAKVIVEYYSTTDRTARISELSGLSGKGKGKGTRKNTGTRNSGKGTRNSGKGKGKGKRKGQ